MARRTETIKTSDRERGYSVGAWKGLANYCCLDCPFATLDEFDMAAHRASRHAPEFIPLAGLITDAGGAPITGIEIEPETTGETNATPNGNPAKPARIEPRDHRR